MSDNSYPVSRDFRLTFEGLSSIGQVVNRPGCVLTLSDERLVTGNGAGGYSVVERDGRVRHVLALGSEGRRYHPNGIALAPDGRVVFAHLGATDGVVFSIDARRNVQTGVDVIDWKPLPPTNYVSVLDCRDYWVAGGQLTVGITQAGHQNPQRFCKGVDECLFGLLTAFARRRS